MMISDGTVLKYAASAFYEAVRPDQDQLVIRRIRQEGSKAISEVLRATWVAHPPGAALSDDGVFHFDNFGDLQGGLDDFLRSLAEIAWKRGWRPVERQDTTGRLEKHLADMRQIAFDRLKVVKPE